MPKTIFDQEVVDAIRKMQSAAVHPTTKPVDVGGKIENVRYPFPSPGDWRDGWIYFLMIDRFNNLKAQPKSAWNAKYDYRQGGTFRGVQDRLDYLVSLGVRAIWLSPVLKNPKLHDPDKKKGQYNYHGYWPQDFLHVDERFGSDGTRATAEQELRELVDAAHARGLYVILDIVINHAGRVFDYVQDGVIKPDVEGPLQQESTIHWLNGAGEPLNGGQDDISPGTQVSPDDVVWPSDFQRKEFFRRRGLGDQIVPERGFVIGDFAKTRQLVAEYLAGPNIQSDKWMRYGKYPVLSILIRCYQYVIAAYDVDGFRLDAAKHVHPEMVEVFGNAIREFALSVGKRNFFTFGEIAAGEDEGAIASFVGRNTTNLDSAGEESPSFGIDAALDFPLFSVLRNIIKGPNKVGVERLRELYQKRKHFEQELLSSHGEAGRFFVTFIDNHDQNERFFHPKTHQPQVTQALALLNCLQGIPCLYYGTEQGLHGTTEPFPDPLPNPFHEPERVREALWGKPSPFETSPEKAPLYDHIQRLSTLRAEEAALRYGRQYFRPVAGDGQNFGFSRGVGGIIAFSRLLVDREILVVANLDPGDRPNMNPWKGSVVVDLDTNRPPRSMTIKYSNLDTKGAKLVKIVSGKFDDGSQADTATLAVELKSMEVQIWVPA